MSFGQEPDPVSNEILLGGVLHLGERVGLRGVYVERLIIQGAFVKRGNVERSCQNGGIEFVPIERLDDLGSGHFPNAQVHLGVSGCKGAEEAGEEVGGDGRDDSKFEFSGGLMRGIQGHVLEFAVFSQNGFGLLDQGNRLGVRKDRLLGPVKKSHPVLLFEFVELHGKGGLGDRAGCCGLAEVAVFVDGDEIFELGDGCHAFSLGRTSVRSAIV